MKYTVDTKKLGEYLKDKKQMKNWIIIYWIIAIAMLATLSGFIGGCLAYVYIML